MRPDDSHDPMRSIYESDQASQEALDASTNPVLWLSAALALGLGLILAFIY